MIYSVINVEVLEALKRLGELECKLWEIRLQKMLSKQE